MLIESLIPVSEVDYFMKFYTNLTFVLINSSKDIIYIKILYEMWSSLQHDGSKGLSALLHNDKMKHNEFIIWRFILPAATDKAFIKSFIVTLPFSCLIDTGLYTMIILCYFYWWL